MDPYAPVPFCNEHTRRHQAGCPKCKRYGAWKDRVWRRRKELGQPTTVPAAEVVAHLQTLHNRGMTPAVVSRASGVPAATIRKLLYSGEGRKWVQARTALPLLAVAVPPEPVAHPPKAELTDCTGSRRRLRALARIGWTYRHVAAASGLVCRQLDELARQQWITQANADRISRAYEQLSMQPGPSDITATRAARAGWAPPLAWDDDTIDDPAALPADVAAEQSSGEYDETTVGQAVDGQLTYEQIAHRDADLVETVRRLAARMTDLDMAHHLRVPGAGEQIGSRRTRGQARIAQLRKHNGIPGYVPPPAPVPEALAKGWSTGSRARPQVGNGRRTYAAVA